jgi:hypothetical protein
MQWSSNIDPLAILGAAEDIHVSRNGRPHLVVHGASLLVADPSVGTTTTRVHPHDVLEAKVLSQGRVDDFYGHGHELPALVADIDLVAARSHVVVVCQIDIEAELLGYGVE